MSKKHSKNNEEINKFIDLKINGRLFPSYILKNFKEYKLPELIKTGIDPCQEKDKKIKQKEELRKYQVFLSKYLNYNSPYHDILLYHNVGSGKTGSAINVYNMLYDYTPGWNVFILLKATLKSGWFYQLNTWLEERDKKYRLENIKFISYDAPNSDKLFLEAVKNSDSSKKSLFIIDEVHNFIRNVYSNISSGIGKRAQTIYDYIIQDKKENDSTRVIVLSATPAINRPFELALLFNLLRPNIFPKSETQFNQEYVTTSSSYETLNIAKKNMFQRRIMGLVSYYYGITPGIYATKTLNYIDVKMSPYQEDIYGFFESLEDKMSRRRQKKGKSSEVYRTYTRQACNFVFPNMAQGMNGESRPRPTQFKISEKENESILNVTNKKEKEKESYYNVQNYIDTINKFIHTFEKFVDEKNEQDSGKRTILDDVKVFHEKYKDNYNEFHEKEKEKSNVYNILYDCSAKLVYVIFTILMSPGPVMVYSNFVLVEGIQIFKIYLKYFGFTNFINKEHGVNNFRYTEYHGQVKDATRTYNKDNFNRKENIKGELIKIIMLSSAGTEGITLKNVRQVHIIEPTWQEVTMTQVIGRAIRMYVHCDLPLSERHVDIFRYKSTRSTDKWTSDQYIEDLARGKEGLIQSFLDAIKEVAVDCVLNQNDNKLTSDIKCFQFDEPSLFDEQIGPAYKEDYVDDSRIDNGSNSVNSKITRIKVIKINGVKLLTNPESGEKLKYSQPENYWYNPETGVIYDFDLHFQIGKIGFDDSGVPTKLNKDTYIIDKLIPIPTIEK
jgi:superfamily II DNA or RNA helicase